jgi:hypothetical protein
MNLVLRKLDVAWRKVRIRAIEPENAMSRIRKPRQEGTEENV